MRYGTTSSFMKSITFNFLDGTASIALFAIEPRLTFGWGQTYRFILLFAPFYVLCVFSI